jgi:hypothetical protein
VPSLPRLRGGNENMKRLGVEVGNVRRKKPSIRLQTLVVCFDYPTIVFDDRKRKITWKI